MDPYSHSNTLCPSGFVTDQAFDSQFPSCDTSISFYWGYMCTIASIKFLTFCILTQTRQYQKRGETKITNQKSTQENNNIFSSIATYLERQHLFRLLVEGSSLIAGVALIVTMGLNVTNFSNAGCWALHTLGYLFFALGRCKSAISAVRFSRRLVPRQVVLDDKQAQMLVHFDNAGIALFVCMVFSTLSAQVALLIVAPIGKGQNEIALAQLGLAGKGTFGLAYQLVCIHQLSRCITVINRHKRALQDGLVPLAEKGMLERTREMLDRAKQKLEFGRTLQIVFLPAPVWFFIVASRVVPWRFSVVGVAFWTEALAGFLESLSAGGKHSLMARLRRRRGPAIRTDGNTGSFSSGDVKNKSKEAGTAPTTSMRPFDREELSSNAQIGVVGSTTAV